MDHARILIVEDEAIVAVDIQECLESFGYHVSGPLADGESALEVILQTPPDLVLMDIMLSGTIDGITTAQKIRTTYDIPVIFLTAYADGSTLERAKVVEPYGYVLKPFKKMELLTVIELALYRHRQEQQKRKTQLHTATEPAAATEQFENVLGNAEKLNHSSRELSELMEVLKKLEPFQSLDLELVRKIALSCWTKDYRAGDLIFSEGENQQSPYLLKTGRILLIKSSPSGKDLIVDLINPLDPFGLLSAIENIPASFTARAQIDSTIIWIPRNIVQFILDKDRETNRALVSQILEKLRKSHDLCRALAHDRAEVRVASALLALITGNEQSQAGKTTIALSRQELAEMTGTTPETASRVANSFERAGFVDLSQLGQVLILKPEQLREMVAF